MSEAAILTRPASLDPRRLSPVPPPAMLVLHKGWWRDSVTERHAADLAQEDRAQEDRDRKYQP